MIWTLIIGISFIGPYLWDTNQKNQVAWTSKQRNSPLFSKMIEIENRMRPLSTKEVEIPCYSCKKKN